MKKILFFTLFQSIAFIFFLILLKNWDNSVFSNWQTFFAWIVLLGLVVLIEQEGFSRGKEKGKWEGRREYKNEIEQEKE